MHNDELWLVCEYMDGGNLAMALTKGLVSWYRRFAATTCCLTCGSRVQVEVDLQRPRASANRAPAWWQECKLGA